MFADHNRTSRRAFLQGSALLLGGLATGPRILAAEAGRQPRFRVGLVTDVHYADKPANINRYYRESLDKLREAVDFFNDSPPTFVAQLGDLIDAGEDIEREIQHLKTIEKVMADLRCDRHYVLGNHCVDGLTKDEFREHTVMDSPHQAFDVQGVRFVILDSCFRSDGEPYGRHNSEWTDANVPAEQLDWLGEQLADAAGPVIVLAHQRLDDAGNYSVRNAAEVREVLEQSGNVLAVFQGHYHRETHERINGIDYCTQVAMVEGSGEASSAYSLLSIYDDHSLRIDGFRRQGDRDLPRT